MVRTCGRLLLRAWTHSDASLVAGWTVDRLRLECLRKFQVYVIGAEGGQPKRLTDLAFDSYIPALLHDSPSAYFSSERNGQDDLWKVSLRGGPAVQMQPQGWSIRFRSSTTGRESEIVRNARPFGPGMSISPDRRTFVYPQVDQEGSDLLAVENVH